MRTPLKSITFRIHSGPSPSNSTLMNPVPTSGSTSKQKSHRPLRRASSTGLADGGLSSSSSSSMAKFSSGVRSAALRDRTRFSSSLLRPSSGDRAPLRGAPGRRDAAIRMPSLVSSAVPPPADAAPVARLTAAPATASTLTGASSHTPRASGRLPARARKGYRPSTASTIPPTDDGMRGGRRPGESPPWIRVGLTTAHRPPKASAARRSDSALPRAYSRRKGRAAHLGGPPSRTSLGSRGGGPSPPPRSSSDPNAPRSARPGAEFTS
mmetsp:Transcript_4069/g.9115  ORF Transcript_4069/g.9115 Transcript_4069/m.9115 type:complete len:267 (+) Transcript_4069:652-1452(+)